MKTITALFAGAFFVLLSIITHSGYSQRWEWAKGIHDIPLLTEELATDAMGNIYMAHHDGAGGINVSKTDPQGNILWETSMGCACPTDGDIRIAVSSSGNAHIIGGFIGGFNFGSQTIQSTTNTEYDIFLIKLNAQGDVVWATNAAGPTVTSADRDIAIDSQGDIIITSAVRGDAHFGSLSSPYDSNKITTFVAKYAKANGNVLWAQRATGGSGISLDTDSQDNIYATGIYSIYMDWGGISFPVMFSQVPYLAKFNPTGNIQWGKKLAGNVTGIATDVFGDSHLSGFFENTISLSTGISLTSAGGSDMMLLKYDTNGEILWARSGGGSGNEIGRDVDIDQSGNSFVVGSYNSTSSFDTEVLNFPGGIHKAGFAASYISNGFIDWVEPIIPDHSTVGERISTTPGGISYIIFDSDSELRFGSDFTLTNPDSPEVLAKLDGNFKKIPVLRFDEKISCFPCWPWEIWRDFEYRFWDERYGLRSAVYRQAFEGDHRDEVYWDDEETLVIKLNEEDIEAGSYQLQIRALLKDGSTTEWTEPLSFEIGEPSTEVFPNPVSDILNINYYGYGEREEVYFLLYNRFGELLLRDTRVANEGLNKWKVEMPRVSTKENPLTFQLISRSQGEQSWQLIRE